jgi:hypothetical protein
VLTHLLWGALGLFCGVTLTLIVGACVSGAAEDRRREP